MSVRPRHPVLRGGPLLIGHRGAAGLAPENTMPSFRAAVEEWAVDMIELDVRATADGECVVIHDATVDRTTDGTGPVAAMTLAELRCLDAGHGFRDDAGQHPFRGRGVVVPTFDEVLSAFPRTRFTVEIKIGTVQEPLEAVIRKHGAADRVVVAGMEHRDQAHFADYEGATSASSRTVRAFVVLHRLHLARLWPRTADVFQVPERHPWDAGPGEGTRIVTRRFVRDAARRGVPVHVWTVNGEADMRRLLDWGVDGLITDRPDRGARVLAELAHRPLPPGLA
ncbi:MAG: glycerophosphodiester phosphodiesterase [Gemmatimonadota bacterium]